MSTGQSSGDDNGGEFIQDKDELIRALAEIGGMKVTTMFDDNLNFKGYNMELEE